MQPHQLGIAREIGDLDEIGCVMLAGEDPPQVTVEKAPVARRVHVVLGVGVQMVMPVLGRPPQHALLGRALRQYGEDELECTAGQVGAMREVSMVSCADRKDAQPVKHRADCDRLPRPVQSAATQAKCTSTNGMADGYMMSACSPSVAVFGLLMGSDTFIRAHLVAHGSEVRDQTCRPMPKGGSSFAGRQFPRHVRPMKLAVTPDPIVDVLGQAVQVRIEPSLT